MDAKRDLEFELILLEERNGRAIQREEARLDDMRHKIEVLKLNQEKIKKDSKQIKGNLYSQATLERQGGKRRPA